MRIEPHMEWGCCLSRVDVLGAHLRTSVRRPHLFFEQSRLDYHSELIRLSLKLYDCGTIRGQLHTTIYHLSVEAQQLGYHPRLNHRAHQEYS
jgi:hypothetical protein